MTTSLSNSGLPTAPAALIGAFPATIDSSMLSTFRSCPQKFFRTYIQHWKPKGESVHLVAGGAFARGLEVARRAFYEDLQPVEDSIAAGLLALIKHYGDFECPPESAKSLERTCGALEYYFSQYPLGVDTATPVLLASGKRAIEFSFAEPLPIQHPVTGDPILYSGRSDMVVDFADGVYIEDDKTTSSLGASWPKQWEMRSQFTGYVWAAQRSALKVKPKGVIIRGVSILKTKYDTMQPVTYRADFEVERWFHQTCRDIKRMVNMWNDWRIHTQYQSPQVLHPFDFSLDAACVEYGGCPLVQICKSPSPEEWLPMYFSPRVWDPLAREEKPVEESGALNVPSPVLPQ